MKTVYRTSKSLELLSPLRKWKKGYQITLLILISLIIFSISVKAQGLPDFTELVNKYSSAVVNISTITKAKKSKRIPGFEDIPKNSPFHEFYRRYFDNQAPKRNTQSLGSGFIISDDGLVITNNHVIKGADKIIVRLSDRNEYEAKLIGSDQRSDIALLKIDAVDLPTVRPGVGYELKVGEWVLAIGSPFGFEYTVTAGIVSAKGRNLPRENYVPFIQTDVAINPGNSGGPLFNLKGEVIGVNAQIYTSTGQYNGLSFAIPIDVAMDVVQQLRTQGRVSRGWLGILIQDVTAELADSFGMDKPNGALVAKVIDGSPAAQAGFRVGDVVTKFNHIDILRSSDLPPIVGRTRINTQTPVQILRDGEEKILEVVIAELPSDPTIPVALAPSSSMDKLGIVVSELTDEQRNTLGISEGGIYVKEIKPGPAADAGIRADDVILMVQNKPIRDQAHFYDLVEDLPLNKNINILIYRGDNPIFLALKITE